MIVLCVINEMDNSAGNQKARQETGCPPEGTSEFKPLNQPCLIPYGDGEPLEKTQRVSNR
jgi:hypothetical protein